MKRTYMLAIQTEVILRPTIYYEVIAENMGEALKTLNKKEAKDILVRYRNEFISEAEMDLSEIVLKDAKVISCGRANQYHSDKECELCLELKNSNERK